MVNTITIRAFASRDWETYRGLRLAALADSPDAFGRTLTEEQERSDAEWSSRLAAGVGSDLDLPLVAEIDGQPIGLAWGRIETSDLDVANLYQMWVAPTYRRRGVGRMLLETVTSWAQSKNACYLELGVTYRDSPAMRLYRRAGFEPVGEPRRLRKGSDLLGQTMRLELKGRAV
jgi:GNAT superfamily N-acetyltransferase